jgi:hypothetical protein
MLLSEFTFLQNIDYAKTINYSTTISYNAFASAPSFEKIDIDTQQSSSFYKDNGTVNYETLIELSKFAVADTANQKEIRGNLLLKTIEIKSTEGSSFGLRIHDDDRNTSRTIPSLYTINRKPYLSGNANNMTTSILSDNGVGFQISAISIECQYNSRSIKKA